MSDWDESRYGWQFGIPNVSSTRVASRGIACRAASLSATGNFVSFQRGSWNWCTHWLKGALLIMRRGRLRGGA